MLVVRSIDCVSVGVLNPRLGQIGGYVHRAGVVGFSLAVIELDQRLKIVGNIPARRNTDHITFGVHILAAENLRPHPVPFLVLISQTQGKRVTHGPVAHHLIPLLSLIPHRNTKPPLILITGLIGDQTNGTRRRIAPK